MEISVVHSDKATLDVTLTSATIAEVMRVYLAENGADFTAWRREHPSKPVIFRIVSDKGAVKAVSAAVSAITKDCEQLRALVKK
ncbi:MAG TPA: hypothetical protein VJK03_01295 [Candidatus Nanoarchaeia archaeon]|nr:hypothetical protein [Candidatus Nanoarchaeia archaeon]